MSKPVQQRVTWGRNWLKGLRKLPASRIHPLDAARFLWRIFSVYRLPIQAQILMSIGLAALTVLITQSLGANLALSGQMALAAGSFLVHLAILHVISSLILFARLGAPLESLVSLQGLVKRQARSALRAFVVKSLCTIQEKLSGVLSEQGLEMDTLETDSWTQICFEAGDAPYDGTDSHVPSQFLSRYRDYLSFHEINIERTRVSGARVLLVTKQSLYDDYASNKRIFERFWNWHDQTRHGDRVELLYIDKSRAVELAGPLPTTDIGIWRGRFAVLFMPTDKGRTVFRMVLQGDPIYEKCLDYFASLRREALPVRYPPTIVEPELAENWESFVDPPARLATETPFLEELLKSASGIQNIFDAATGIGVESVLLFNKGYHVTSNEVDDHLRRCAVDYSARQTPPVQLTYTTHDWRDLCTYQGPKFDMVLVLGNSLCLISDAGHRELSIRGFAHILRPGGLLVVDERNFPRILRSRKEILENPILNFRYKATIMYCGTIIRGCPVRLNGEKITFAYYQSGRSIRDWDDLKKEGVVKGTLDMYPFKADELPQLLTSNGFGSITKYSDLKRGDNPDADFFTYVAIRC